MARVVVVGGGIVGLGGALLLARDGHDVTVFERDPTPPSAPADAWATWERRGVNQFRQGHFLLARFRAIVDVELPDVAAAFDAAGALRYNTLAGVPVEMSGGMRPDDDRFEILTARRPVSEAVFANAAATTPGCAVRRGASVKALRVTEGRVDGVVLDGDEIVPADVVVDAGGRRSPMGALAVEAGLTAPVEERHDFGFVYYGRHLRSPDGSVPPAFGPLLQAYESLSIATLPADNGHWAVVVVTSGNDRAIRALRDPAVWERVVRSYPMIAHWLEGAFVEDAPQVMAAIEDRYRHFCPEGVPVAPGVLPLGDAFACTNPSVGRGISIGLMHAVALRDLLRRADVADAHALSLEWDSATERSVGGYVRDTLFFDRHRLAEIDAQIAGVPYEPEDPERQRQQQLFGHAGEDPELLRGVVDVMSTLARPVEVFARPALTDRLAERTAASPIVPFPGPSRAELLSLLGA
jgi:2-polyprenyl-6-methoxyphenol hydroxylase-like FAD-dependent oxidoreductase